MVDEPAGHRSRWVTTEQEALVATLRSADPDAPTLDEGWDVRRLVAHLVQREHSAVAMVTDAAARRPPGEEPGLSRLTGRAQSPQGYAALVDRFAAGAPRWSPFSWAAEQTNHLEYLIHHEDVRRGGPDPAAPRELPAGQQDAVWRQLGMLALGLRRAPVGVQLARPEGAVRLARKRPTVTLTGEPVELALWVSGRRTAAHVEVTGEPDAVATFRRWAAAS
ncbi:TIGR03085 family metal-binding protein [Microlunatus flavus]|uniref:TIGR03085 family protein n=1 Tax=Microlunatus flavus TaxID=1036181 RepID=A0A1H9C565_9ACTN|nr:TIGR03085 family metal-binding protein [Microlunatus flavus]SEP96380.1 TIGR03085 family protein [Microlunatus flavus]